LEIEPAIVFGRRGPQIVQYADQHQMDLIVLSSHVVDPRRPGEGWATLSYQVSIACPCPVLLVKNALGPGEGS
jgi:nucleotide-binding universal stress UspA family protein